MMYIWNGYAVIGKCPNLTEGMLETLIEAEAALASSSGNRWYGLSSSFTVQ